MLVSLTTFVTMTTFEVHVLIRLHAFTFTSSAKHTHCFRKAAKNCFKK